MTVTRQLVIFFSIAFAYTWIGIAWMILGHLRIEFSILASFGPTLAALVTNRLADGHYQAFQFNVNSLRTAGASVLGISLIVTAFVILPATATVDSGKLNWSILASTSVYNYSTLLGGPLFEEPGWRGYALPRLESLFSPLAATLILGAMWTAWHLPLFLYPGWTECPVWIYALILTSLSVIMTLGANLARFGVIAPILMHAIFNTQGRFLGGLFTKAQPGSGGFLNVLVASLPAPAGWGRSVNLSFPLLIALSGWTVAFLVVILTKGRLGYRRSPSLRHCSDPVKLEM